MTSTADTVLRRRSHAVLPALLGGLTIAGLALVYLFDPATSGFYPPCVLHSLTGLQCPGCGGTRAIHQLMHGNVAAAFRLNPMLFPAIALVPVLAMRPALLTKPWVAWTAAAILLAWGILRNI